MRCPASAPVAAPPVSVRRCVRGKIIDFAASPGQQCYQSHLCGADCPSGAATDLHNHDAYPAQALGRRQSTAVDRSETSLKEAKSGISGAGPSTGAMLRSRSRTWSPREHAAWVTATGRARAGARGDRCPGRPGQARRAARPPPPPILHRRPAGDQLHHQGPAHPRPDRDRADSASASPSPSESRSSPSALAARNAAPGGPWSRPPAPERQPGLRHARAPPSLSVEGLGAALNDASSARDTRSRRRTWHWILLGLCVLGARPAHSASAGQPGDAIASPPPANPTTSVGSEITRCSGCATMEIAAVERRFRCDSGTVGRYTCMCYPFS